jgi:predicted phosphoribosyltransferase
MMGAELALAGVGAQAVGAGLDFVAQRRKNDLIRKANKQAEAEAKRQQAEIDKQKRAEDEDRRRFIEEERVVLGPGLGNAMGTRASNAMGGE